MGWKGSLLLIWAHAALPGPQVEQNCFYGCMLLYAFTGRWLPLAFIRQCSAQCAGGKTHLLHIVLQDLRMVEPDY